MELSALILCTHRLVFVTFAKLDAALATDDFQHRTKASTICWLNKVIEKVNGEGIRSKCAMLNQEPANTRVRWVECDELDHLGHGVQFLQDELRRRRDHHPVAFLEGFEVVRAFCALSEFRRNLCEALGDVAPVVGVEPS